MGKSSLRELVIILIATLLCRDTSSVRCYCSDGFCKFSCDRGNCCEDVNCFVRLIQGENEDVIDYGCTNIYVCSGIDSTGPTIQGVYFECCSDEPYCNLNLSIPYPSTSILSSSDKPAVTSTESPGTSLNKAAVIASSVVIPVVLLCLLCIVAPLIAFVVYKKGMLGSRSQTLSNDKNGYPFSKGNMDSFSVMQVIDPTPITISDMTLTCTSGSGGGMPHLVERTIARGFTLGEMIGGGRFGQVYLGSYQEEKYAVKKFFSRDEQSWFREREIYNSFNMRHDNILTYVAADILSNNGVTELWLITQFHSRGSLFDELHRESLSMEQMIKYIFSACRGMAYLHMEFPGTQGKPCIAHRDLKSKNLLVKNDETLCIADFGLAVVASSTRLREPESLKQGTKRYMAPELLEEKLNPKYFESFVRTDIYSFGIVLWEICWRSNSPAGSAEEYELPFQYLVPHDPSFEDMRDAVVLKGLTPDLPDSWNQDELLKGLSKLMTECWYRDPAARPTSFHIRKKLGKLIDNCDVKITTHF